MFGINKLGFKIVKNLIDNFFRKKVIPVEGSVLYTELYIFVQHSGIYVGNGEISNVIVGGIKNLLNNEAEILLSDRYEFVEKAILSKKIYVSSNRNGAVGDINVSNYARSKVGSDWYYVLHNNNCHIFSARCLGHVGNFGLDKVFNNNLSFNVDLELDDTWEPTIKNLKKRAEQKLGATKWLIWDEDDSEDDEIPELNEQDIEDILREYEKTQLDKSGIENLKNEQLELKEYINEISDENIPQNLTNHLYKIEDKLDEINDNINGKYKKFLNHFIIENEEENNKEKEQIIYTYNDLKVLPKEIDSIIKEMELNYKIQAIIKKIGKNKEENQKEIEITEKNNIKRPSKNQVFGIYKSNEIERILPSELVLLENEELENLFYAKMYENSLLTYEIAGNENKEEKEEKIQKEKEKIKGPVIACLDTSGSMEGQPLLKAKSLLLSIAKILEKENRKLYVILFGASGQILECNIENKGEIIKLIKFLQQGFYGGTDFNTPLQRALKIIKNDKTEYNKADILFITDGLCTVNNENLKLINEEKQKNNVKIYTINCSLNSNNNFYQNKLPDNFSDEIIGI